MSSGEILNRMTDEAWKRAVAETAMFVSSIANETQMPAMQAAGETAQRRHFVQEFVTEIMRSLYESNVLVATAISEGVLTLDEAATFERQATEFVIAVRSGKRFFCPVAPCDWRGTLEAVGPTGRCPKCGTAPLAASPEAAQGLVIP